MACCMPPVATIARAAPPTFFLATTCSWKWSAMILRRSRNASRAATLGNSKVGAEIRSTRLMVRELLEVTVSGDLDPAFRKRLAEVVQLVQSYCRLAELEIAAGERPRAEDVALPEDTGQRVKGWAEDEAEREKER